MSCELVVKADAAAVAREAVERFVGMARAAVAQRERFRVALSGGGTPGLLYRLLVARPYRSQVPWSQTQFYWGDERFLPAGDPGRNDTSMLPLLAEVGVPQANIFPVPFVAGAGESPAGRASLAQRMETAARSYEALLREQAHVDEPLLDLVLLGLGTDGHTASLFPGTAALDETRRLVLPNRAIYEDRHPERITLTLPAINAAGAVMFLVTGPAKREILGRVLGEPEDPPLPAQRVQPGRGALIWLVDRAAYPDP